MGLPDRFVSEVFLAAGKWTVILAGSTMAFLIDLFSYHGKFLGIEWGFWKVIGWLGNLVFTARFLVQWRASEKRKQVVVPSLFWWLSIVGSLLLLAYALCFRRDSVMIASYAFNWIPYVRNLLLHYRAKSARIICPAPGCGVASPREANYCAACGLKLTDL
jgi:lipid-A-disaccharide synthase-like uncharacterized protein